MITDKPQRISGTCWERFLIIALPFPALAFIPYFINNGTDAFTSGAWEAPLFMIIIALLIWMVDCEPITRQKPVPMLVNGMIEIGSDLVRQEDISRIIPLLRYRQRTVSIFEIHYTVQGTERAARIMSKPDPPILNMLFSRPKTIRKLLKHFPGLTERLQPEQRI